MKIRKIVAPAILAIIIATGSIFAYTKYLNYKSENEVKKHTEEIEDWEVEVKSESELLKDSLETKESGKLIVSENSVKVNHSTKYSETIGFNMYGEEIKTKATVTKAGSARILFNYYIDMNQMKSEYNKEDDILYIIIKKPELDKRTIKLEEGSFKLDKSKSGINFAGKVKITSSILGNKTETMDARAERKLEEEIVTLGKEKIEDMYSSNSKEYKNVCNNGIKIVTAYINEVATSYDLKNAKYIVKYE